MSCIEVCIFSFHRLLDITVLTVKDNVLRKPVHLIYVKKEKGKNRNGERKERKQNKTEQNRTGQVRTGQDRTEQNITEQK